MLERALSKHCVNTCIRAPTQLLKTCLYIYREKKSPERLIIPSPLEKKRWSCREVGGLMFSSSCRFALHPCSPHSMPRGHGYPSANGGTSRRLKGLEGQGRV